MGQVPIRQVNDYVWEIPKQGGMRVPGRVYATRELMADIRKDAALEQVANVAHLPGIVGYSLAMPDIHWGYGFPIGGVAAVDAEEGVITPGGIGFAEASLALLLISFGVDQPRAISIALCFRLFDFWLPLAMGALSFVLLRKGDLEVAA